MQASNNDTADRQMPGTELSEGWSSFTEDWFTKRIPAWKKHILPACLGKPIKWLEIGSFEGRSALWTMENVLTHLGSCITCIDPWFDREVEARFDGNIETALKVLQRPHEFVTKVKGRSQDFLPGCGLTFDVIYIDGDHQAKSALTDAVICWLLLPVGGFLIFDDYRWDFRRESDKKAGKIPCRFGIEAFLDLWKADLEVVHKDYQVIIRKTKP